MGANGRAAAVEGLVDGVLRRAERFVSGEREVEFPLGTRQMRVRLGCPVAAAHASA